jgi:hypothetical protein
MDGVGRGAVPSALGTAGRERHVGLVVGRVEVDTIPARGEVDLRSAQSRL